MAVEVIRTSRQLSSGLKIIGDDSDVIEKEKELRLPLHKRLELVAGFNIHTLVKDARQHRHTLHTRKGFYLASSPSEIAALFERAPTRTTASAKSLRRSAALSAKSSKHSTVSGKSSKRSIATTTTSSSPSSQNAVTQFEQNSDQLRFDHIHGSNVTLSYDRYTATRRHNSFCDGIVLGHRPIKVGERVHIKFNKVRRDWRGGFRLGFTTQAPSRLIQEALPSYAVPDLSRTSRFWAVPVPDKYVAKNNVFSFLLQSDGRVLYFINNENKGTFLKGLNSRKPFWPVMDLYGRVIKVTIVDEKTAEEGNANFTADDSEGEGGGDHGVISEGHEPGRCSFHETCGRNIRMDVRRCIAKRVDSFWNSLTFLSEPIRPHDVIYVEIARANLNYAGALGIGITDVDPSSININDLPDNADLLTKNMSQYWFLSRDVETHQGDQLGFEMDESGRITYSKNGESAIPHMNADISKKPLWFVFDVYGSTTTIRLMGIIRACDPSCPLPDQERYTISLDDVTHSDDDTECMMCFKKDRQKNCAIQPCGHMTLCCWCAITCMVKQTLRFIVCPICGGPVRDVIKILSPSKDSRIQITVDKVE